MSSKHEQLAELSAKLGAAVKKVSLPYPEDVQCVAMLAMLAETLDELGREMTSAMLADERKERTLLVDARNDPA